MGLRREFRKFRSRVLLWPGWVIFCKKFSECFLDFFSEKLLENIFGAGKNF